MPSREIPLGAKRPGIARGDGAVSSRRGRKYWLDRRRRLSVVRLSSRGFTITDLVVAVAVASILSSAAFPGASAIYESYALRSAIDQIRLEVARAQMQAAAQSRFVRIDIDKDGALVREYSEDGVIYTVDGAPLQLPGAIEVTIYYAHPEFGPSGLGTSSSVIAVNNSQARELLLVNPLGKVFEL